VKGAPDTVLENSTKILKKGGSSDILDYNQREELKQDIVRILDNKGQTTMAVAFREIHH